MDKFYNPFKILKKAFLFSFIVFSAFNSQAQERNIGAIINTKEAYDGYTLIAGKPHKEATYLIDNCGRVVHKWPVVTTQGNSAQMLNDGSIIRLTTVQNPNILIDWGRIEKVDWNGNLVWEYTYSDSTHKMHHEIEPLPNGNVLLLAYELIDTTVAKINGRKILPQTNSMWVDHIVEIKPKGKSDGEIVWKWCAWDHLIQDTDSTKANYGNIAEHPELIDINSSSNIYSMSDWLHANSLSYNAELDQIIISIRTFSEFWIIDHSTTTLEAASHKGGKYNKGGDILYRWGNPQVYKSGDSSDQVLYFQHDANWIPKNYPGAGNILVFNNGLNSPIGNASSINEIKIPKMINGKYPKTKNKAYLPDTFITIYKNNLNPLAFFSPNFSGTRRLPNGNTIVVEGVKGNVFEVNKFGKIVWQYISPINMGVPIGQNDTVTFNAIFQVEKYPKNHPAFKGKDLTPKGYIEKMPIKLEGCD